MTTAGAMRRLREAKRRAKAMLARKRWPRSRLGGL